MQEVSNDLDKIRLSIEQPVTPGPSFDAPFVRERTVSEPAERVSEDIAKSGAAATRRKPIVRSLTEVRPDAYIFDNGQHIEYRYDEEEEDDCNEEVDVIPKSGN